MFHVEQNIRSLIMFHVEHYVFTCLDKKAMYDLVYFSKKNVHICILIIIPNNFTNGGFFINKFYLCLAR